jgi:hypothetical protein
VNFTLSLADPLLGSGQGIAMVTDAAGNLCRVTAAYTPVPAGPIQNLPLYLEPALGIKFYVGQGTAVTSGTAILAGHTPNPDDVGCLPACFQFTADSLVLLIESPIAGDTLAAHDINGGNDLRLLFKHPSDRCPYVDVSDSVQGLIVDPRLSGGAKWSTVQFAAAIQSPGCTPSRRQDEDRDGFSFGGNTSPASADCNDANPDISPGATEVCNGIDDDCDGSVDEGILCGTIQIQAVVNTVSDGNVTKNEPLVGTEVRIYDQANPCVAAFGNSPQNYSQIWGSGGYINPGCLSVTSGGTDESGNVTFFVAPGSYIAIGRPAPPFQQYRIGATVGTVNAGGFARKQIQLVVDTNGNVVPSRTP